MTLLHIFYSRKYEALDESYGVQWLFSWILKVEIFEIYSVFSTSDSIIFLYIDMIGYDGMHWDENLCKIQ